MRWVASRSPRSTSSGSRPANSPSRCWPSILRGGQDKVHEAGAFVVGGHTIIDEELKFGLSVTGRVHPDRILSNAAARPATASCSPKPIGTGLLATAEKQGELATDEADGAVCFHVHAQRRGQPRGARRRCALRHRRHRLRAARPRVAHRARQRRHAGRSAWPPYPRFPAPSPRGTRGMRTGGAERNLAYLHDTVEWNGAARALRAHCSSIRRRPAGCSSPCHRIASPSIFRSFPAPWRSVRCGPRRPARSRARVSRGEWMGPGGSHGLQNRSRPDDVGLGGFDSHALPPPRAGRRS